MVEIREMALAELDRVNEISVTERGDIVYTYFEGDIVAQPEVWQRPPRSREGWQVLVDRWTGYLHRGGVILGATLILYAISNDLRSTITRMSERAAVFFSTTGAFIYAGTGALCLFLGANYLDYSALAAVLGVDPVTARSHGILMVEIGVGIAVMAVMVSMYYNLSSVGKHDEGL